MSEIRLVKNTTDITSFVKTVKTSGSSEKFNRVLDAEMLATADGRKRAYTIELGSTVKFYVNGVLDFVGVVFSLDTSTDGSLNFTAYDSNVYLAKSQDTRIYKNKKASDIIRIIASDFGIKTGEIADTGYVIPFLMMKNRSLREHIAAALTLTRNQTGKRFFVWNEAGKLTLREGKAPAYRYVLSAGKNLMSVSYSRSIEDTKTQVKVIGGKKGKETVVISKDNDKRAKYGVLQAVEVMDEKASPSQVKQRVSILLKEQSKVAEQLTVEAMGVREVKTGTAVSLRDDMTGASGNYYVTNDTHTYSAGLHTMSLELTYTFELEQVLPDVEKEQKKVIK